MYVCNLIYDTRRELFRQVVGCILVIKSGTQKFFPPSEAIYFLRDRRVGLSLDCMFSTYLCVC